MSLVGPVFGQGGTIAPTPTIKAASAKASPSPTPPPTAHRSYQRQSYRPRTVVVNRYINRTVARYYTDPGLRKEVRKSRNAQACAYEGYAWGKKALENQQDISYNGVYLKDRVNRVIGRADGVSEAISAHGWWILLAFVLIVLLFYRLFTLRSSIQGMVDQTVNANLDNRLPVLRSGLMDEVKNGVGQAERRLGRSLQDQIQGAQQALDHAMNARLDRRDEVINRNFIATNQRITAVADRVRAINEIAQETNRRCTFEDLAGRLADIHGLEDAELD